MKRLVLILRKFNQMDWNPRFFVIVILLFYILNSLILLPAFNKTRFLVFDTWNIFSFMPNKTVYDITWDKGKTFLFKDHKEARYRVGTIYMLYLISRSFQGKESARKRLYKVHYPKIIKYCQCQELYLVLFKGSWTDYIIHKKSLPIQRMEKL